MSASAANLVYNISFRLCVDHHSVDVPLFGNIFGRASASEAQAPKAKAKRRASPFGTVLLMKKKKKKQATFFVEQVNEEASTTSGYVYIQLGQDGHAAAVQEKRLNALCRSTGGNGD